MNRRQAREEAFILIFEKQFNSANIEEILEIAAEVRDLEPDEYITTVFKGVYENIEEIDGVISENAIGWKIGRISKVSLCILRLAIFEIKFMDSIPVSVSINEAVELAKSFSDDDVKNMINGILDKIYKDKVDHE